MAGGWIRRALTLDNLVQAVVSGLAGVAVSALVRVFADLDPPSLISIGAVSALLVLAVLLLTRAHRVRVETERLLSSLPSQTTSGSSRDAEQRGWVTPEELEAYIESLKDVVEQQGFGREPPPPPKESDMNALIRTEYHRAKTEGSPSLGRRAREQLEDLVREGDRLLEKDEIAQEEWTTRVIKWLTSAGQKYTARNLGKYPFAEQVRTLRATLVNNAPPGFTGDLTMSEALDRAMQVENVPYDQRGHLLETARELELEMRFPGLEKIAHKEPCSRERFESFHRDGPSGETVRVTRCLDCGSQVVLPEPEPE